MSSTRSSPSYSTPSSPLKSKPPHHLPSAAPPGSATEAATSEATAAVPVAASQEAAPPTRSAPSRPTPLQLRAPPGLTPEGAYVVTFEPVGQKQSGDDKGRSGDRKNPDQPHCRGHGARHRHHPPDIQRAGARIERRPDPLPAPGQHQGRDQHQRRNQMHGQRQHRPPDPEMFVENIQGKKAQKSDEQDR